MCPGKLALHYVNSSRLLLQSDDESGDSTQLYGRADTDTLLSTFPTSVCTRISESACAGVWRHRVYNSAKEEIGQSLIFVGGESWGIPSDRSIIGDLDQESVSTLLLAYKVSFETSSIVTLLLNPLSLSLSLVACVCSAPVEVCARRELLPQWGGGAVLHMQRIMYAMSHSTSQRFHAYTLFIHITSHYFFETAQLKPSFPLSPLPSYSA